MKHGFDALYVLYLPDFISRVCPGLSKDPLIKLKLRLNRIRKLVPYRVKCEE